MLKINTVKSSLKHERDDYEKLAQMVADLLCFDKTLL